MELGKSLALIAAGGILLGVGACGGSDPPANTPASDPAAAGAKASCNSGHTDDKSHCNAVSADAGK